MSFVAYFLCKRNFSMSFRSATNDFHRLCISLAFWQLIQNQFHPCHETIWFPTFWMMIQYLWWCFPLHDQQLEFDDEDNSQLSLSCTPFLALRKHTKHERERLTAVHLPFTVIFLKLGQIGKDSSWSLLHKLHFDFGFGVSRLLAFLLELLFPDCSDCKECFFFFLFFESSSSSSVLE